jgi:hypothetical protein
MNRTARRETKCCQAVHKLILSLNSKSCQPSGILIHRQNSYAPGRRRRTFRRKTRSREPVNKFKKILYLEELNLLS